MGLTKRELAEAEAQLQATVREKKRGVLTKGELDKVEDNTPMYQSVGKFSHLTCQITICIMYIISYSCIIIRLCRRSSRLDLQDYSTGFQFPRAEPALRFAARPPATARPWQTRLTHQPSVSPAT